MGAPVQRKKPFTSDDAYRLAGRLATQWPSRFAEDLAIDTLAREFELQFADCQPGEVERATTLAIAESEFMPTVAKIKAKMREPVSAALRSWRPPSGVSEEYRKFHERDRALTIEAAARAKNLPDDDIGFGKIARRALPRV